MGSAQKKTELMISNRGRSIGQVVGTATLMVVSCLVTYWLITNALADQHFVSRDEDLMGVCGLLLQPSLCFEKVFLRTPVRRCREQWQPCSALRSIFYIWSSFRFTSWEWSCLSE